MSKKDLKIVAVIGSCRRGNTFAMVDAACRALKGKCKMTVVDLRELDIRPCDGCLQCDKTGRCYIQDDMQEIVTEVANADAFIFGTPARWGLLSGELKVFFDRLNPLASRETLKGKKAVIFAVGQSAEDQSDSIGCARDSVVHFCRDAGIKVLDSVLAYDCLGDSDLGDKSPDVLAKCEVAAGKLLQDFA
jgi:multimeric flavodoxin WrbA